MAKDQMRYMQSWGEVAPRLVLLTNQKSPSRLVPKLETILEEGSENRIKFAGHTLNPNSISSFSPTISLIPRGARKASLLFTFPVAMSVVSYYFLQYRSASP